MLLFFLMISYPCWQIKTKRTVITSLIPAFDCWGVMTRRKILFHAHGTIQHRIYVGLLVKYWQQDPHGVQKKQNSLQHIQVSLFHSAYKAFGASGHGVLHNYSASDTNTQQWNIICRKFIHQLIFRWNWIISHGTPDVVSLSGWKHCFKQTIFHTTTH